MRTTFIMPAVAIVFLFAVCAWSCKKTSASSTTGAATTTSSSVTVSTLASSSNTSTFNAGPHGIVADNRGNLFISTDRGAILEMNALGLFSTFAGGASLGCEEGSGTGATFTAPFDICIDGNNNIYVADYNCGGIKQVNSGGTSQLYCKSDLVNDINLESPTAVGVDPTGKVYAGGEIGTDGITVITQPFKAAHLAGNGVLGTADGTALQAEFVATSGICADDNGNVFVADGNSIRVISQGLVRTLAGGSKPGYADGNGGAALFGGAMGICLDSKGNLFVADPYNQCIREVTAGGTVTTVAGVPGVQGYQDGAGNLAKFSAPVHLCFDLSGNLMVADLGNGAGDLNFSGRIRKLVFKK
jgi:hypothetical protein